jgi:signal transduction histidine kinase
MEADRIVLQLVDVDLHTLCAAAVADMEAIAAQKGLELIAELPAPGGSIGVDPSIFRRILDNLLTNAIKFSPSKSQVVLKAHYREGGQATIQIADSGPGVTEEMKQKVFEKFETGTFIKNIPQVGLGLAFCKMAVQAHGGKIQVEQNYPQGAIFTVDL